MLEDTKHRGAVRRFGWKGEGVRVKMEDMIGWKGKENQFLFLQLVAGGKESETEVMMSCTNTKHCLSRSLCAMKIYFYIFIIDNGLGR